MRVRRFELRLLASVLLVCWVIAALLILLAYRPGGPFDLVVGLTAMTPIVIAMAGVIWPPVARGDISFPLLVWLGIIALLCLVPSITGIVNQLVALDTQTLLPSFEAAYPWLVALLATSLFSGFGIAAHLGRGAAPRRQRLVRGVAFAVVVTTAAASMFAAVAVANDTAIRAAGPIDSRFGPTAGEAQPPLCDGVLTTGPSARIAMHLAGQVDLRPIGTVDLDGLRVGPDFRWTAYVATDRELGTYGAARAGGRAWAQEPRARWHDAQTADVADDTVDQQALDVVLTPGFRATAEDRGVEVIEGARARHCRLAVDGTDFLAAFPQARWLIAAGDVHRWRGQLDYWVFTDGELGEVTGSINGEADGFVPDGIQATIDVRMTATERGRDFVIYPPAQ
jgi:hypothetical protein